MYIIAAKAQELDPDSVVADVTKNGAINVVAKLIDSSHWHLVMDRISSGDPRWLTVAAALRPGVDGSSGDDLQDAESNALVSQPYVYLEYSESTYGLSAYSTCNLGWDGEVPGGMQKYLSRLESSLIRNASSKVSGAKEDCLKGLRESRNSFLIETVAEKKCSSECGSYGGSTIFRGIESEPWCECFVPNSASIFPARDAPNNSLQGRRPSRAAP